MKSCPICNRTYTDETLRFCLEDGTPLVSQEQTTAPTLVMPAQPPPTVAYDPGRITAATQGPPSWTLEAQPKPKRKVWPWVLGGLVLLLVLGVGSVVAIVWVVSLSSNENSSGTGANNSKPVASPSRAVANQTPASTPAATNVEIKNVYMARDKGGEVGDEAESFSPSERIVHCVVELSDARVGTSLKWKWIAVDAGGMKDHLIKELEYTTKAQETKVHADLTLQQDWPEGDWKVDVYLNGKLARSVTYKVEQ